MRAGLHQLLDICVRASRARPGWRSAADLALSSFAFSVFLCEVEPCSPGIWKVCGRFGPLLEFGFLGFAFVQVGPCSPGFWEGADSAHLPTGTCFFRGAGLTCGLRFEDKESLSVMVEPGSPHASNFRYFLLRHKVNSRRCSVLKSLHRRCEVSSLWCESHGRRQVLWRVGVPLGRKRDPDGVQGQAARH